VQAYIQLVARQTIWYKASFTTEMIFCPSRNNGIYRIEFFWLFPKEVGHGHWMDDLTDRERIPSFNCLKFTINEGLRVKTIYLKYTIPF